MKHFKYIGFILLTFLFLSCSQKENEPTLAQKVIGEYKGTSINMGGTEIPIPFISDKNSLDLAFNIQTISDYSVALELNLIESTNGVAETTTENHPLISLLQNTDGSISLIEKGQILAIVSGQNIELTVEFNDLKTVFRGVKK